MLRWMSRAPQADSNRESERVIWLTDTSRSRAAAESVPSSAMRVNTATSSSWSFIGSVWLVLRKLQSRFRARAVSRASAQSILAGVSARCIEEAPVSGASLPTIEVPLTFIAPTTARPSVLMSAKHEEGNRRTGDFQSLPIDIVDARGLSEPPILDEEGFALKKHRTSVADFYDRAAVEEVYYAEIAELLRLATGAAEVHVFDHTLRVEDEAKRRIHHTRLPVSIVHNDYTEASALQRVRDVLAPEAAERLLAGRFAIVNVWRSFGASAERFPLAVADGRTVLQTDYVAVDLIYSDRTGEIYYTAHSSGQRWFYFSRMQPDEILLFKCFDSVRDGRTRYTAHTGFANPHAPTATPPRESIEVRTLLYFP